MDLTNKDFIRIYNSTVLLHRLIERLTEKERRHLAKQSLLPGVQLLALKIKKLYDTDLDKSISLAIKYLPKYLEWLPSRTGVTLVKNIKDIHHVSELECRGYKRLPSKNFKRSLRKLGLNEKGNYIMTNRVIDGDLWIYPEDMAHDYKELREGKHYIWATMALAGVPGITKVYINDIKHQE